MDTPGFDDPEKNRDAEIISELAEKLQSMNEIHQILIAANGTNPRLDGSMKAMIDIFQRMFTPQIWDNIGIVFTKLHMDKILVFKEILKVKFSILTLKYASLLISDNHLSNHIVWIWVSTQ